MAKNEFNREIVHLIFTQKAGDFAITHGYRATRRVLRHDRICKSCRQLIEAGTYYYSVSANGSGLGGLKFPDYVHVACLEAYKTALTTQLGAQLE